MGRGLSLEGRKNNMSHCSVSPGRIAIPCITGGVEGRLRDQEWGGALCKAPARPAGRARNSVLSSPTALPAIFPLWLPSRPSNKSLLSRRLCARRGGQGVRGLSPCPQSASKRSPVYALFLKKSRQTGPRNQVGNHVGRNLPSGLPAPNQSFALFERCTLITVHLRPLIN